MLKRGTKRLLRNRYQWGSRGSKTRKQESRTLKNLRSTYGSKATRRIVKSA